MNGAPVSVGLPFSVGSRGVHVENIAKRSDECPAAEHSTLVGGENYLDQPKPKKKQGLKNTSTSGGKPEVCHETRGFAFLGFDKRTKKLPKQQTHSNLFISRNDVLKLPPFCKCLGQITEYCALANL